MKVVEYIFDKIQCSKQIIGSNDLYIIDLKHFISITNLMFPYLSVCEQQKAKYIIKEEVKHLYILRKSLLRIILSQYIQQEPENIGFEISTYGKPYLMDVDNLFFNISHSKTLLAVAISRITEIGVDIQIIKHKKNQNIILKDILKADEIKKYNEIDDINKRELYFYKLWVNKEAVSKAIGYGIIADFSSFSVLDNDIILKKKLIHIERSKIVEGYAYALASVIK